MTKHPIVQYQLWAGPLRPTQKKYGVNSTRCLGVIRGPGGEEHYCGEWTVNGDWMCYRCKDPNGYAERLQKAHQEARQRCLEAYPVCKHCGLRLTPAQVKAGVSSHQHVFEGDCQLSADERAAQERA